MSIVGAFPGIENPNKITRRAPVNPLDKSTVVSIFPKHIVETKPTIQPGIFEIQPGSYENPAVLVVGPSSWWREIDDDQPLIEIPVWATQISDAIIKDYCNGLLACNMLDCMPGMFHLPGQHTSVNIKKDYKPLLDLALDKQKRWYLALVKLADSLWARSNGNPVAIPDDARLAARSLDLHSKEWLKDYQMVELVRCIACGSLKNPAFPVCPTCKAIDQKHPDAGSLKFVQ